MTNLQKLSSPRRRIVSNIFFTLLCLFLPSCAEENCSDQKSNQFYQSKNHAGSKVPNWYRPPETQKNSFSYQRPDMTNGNPIKYDR